MSSSGDNDPMVGCMAALMIMSAWALFLVWLATRIL